MDDNKVAVLLEDLQGQFRIFGEGLQILHDKVDNLDKKVDTIDHKVNNLELRLGSLEFKVDSLESKVGSLESKLNEHIKVNHQEHLQLMQMIRETDSDLQTMKRIK
jgi:predicted nuclease with TOPRIM domain